LRRAAKALAVRYVALRYGVLTEFLLQYVKLVGAEVAELSKLMTSDGGEQSERGHYAFDLSINATMYGYFIVNDRYRYRRYQ